LVCAEPFEATHAGEITGNQGQTTLASGTAVEIGLYEILHQVVPDRVLAPIAVDVTRGWIVLPDGGASLGECFTPSRRTSAHREHMRPERLDGSGRRQR
jgi:hypothetical protein